MALDLVRPVGDTEEMSNHLWSNARQGSSLHRICAFQGSYPPQLAAHFIREYGADAEVVLDPFCGRGTTLLEAAQAGKRVIGADLFAVSRVLSSAKLDCPPRAAVLAEIAALRLDGRAPPPPSEVEPFYHPDTWAQLWALKQASRSNALTALTLGRLHGHSPGFFSATTFNVISVTGESMRRACAKHGTTPERRDVRAILAKAAVKFIPEGGFKARGGVIAADARALPLPDRCVDLVVTSPPFLDVIDYAQINWLRGWFLGHEEGVLPPPTILPGKADYAAFIRAALEETRRVLVPGGRAVFEVGPVKRDASLEEVVVAGAKGLLELEKVSVHSFAGAGVAKISRAMKGGVETTTMENRCVVMRRATGRLMRSS